MIRMPEEAERANGMISKRKRRHPHILLDLPLVDRRRHLLLLLADLLHHHHRHPITPEDLRRLRRRRRRHGLLILRVRPTKTTKMRG